MASRSTPCSRRIYGWYILAYLSLPRSNLQWDSTYINSTFAKDEFWIHRSVVHIGTTGSAKEDLNRMRTKPIFLGMPLQSAIHRFNWYKISLKGQLSAADSYLEGLFPLVYFDVIREGKKTAWNVAIAACFPIVSPVTLTDGYINLKGIMLLEYTYNCKKLLASLVSQTVVSQNKAQLCNDSFPRRWLLHFDQWNHHFRNSWMRPLLCSRVLVFSNIDWVVDLFLFVVDSCCSGW